MAAQAQAVQIFATNNLRAAGATSDTLIRFDHTNPAAWVTVGSMGVPGAGFGGLDFAGIGGDLFGYVSFASGTPPVTSGLYRVNTTTGMPRLSATAVRRSRTCPGILWRTRCWASTRSPASARSTTSIW